jgi:16S rRNA processing protein RimM
MLYANKEDITLEDDEIWASDLIDCEVYDKGVLIGTVSDFYNQGVQDLLVVNHNGKDIMIPYVDAFIKNKDVENKRIDVELIEGFINED